MSASKKARRSLTPNAKPAAPPEPTAEEMLAAVAADRQRRHHLLMQVANRFAAVVPTTDNRWTGGVWRRENAEHDTWNFKGEAHWHTVASSFDDCDAIDRTAIDAIVDEMGKFSLEMEKAFQYGSKLYQSISRLAARVRDGGLVVIEPSLVLRQHAEGE